MVNDSKILTVSYGTFSCTLEGFDDPFNTMRSIAEYFRDLAADDRYFGAEPPTPDPQMLHTIAEKEIQRRVEARVQDNGLILRQMEEDTDAPAQDAASEAAPAEPVAPVAPATPAAKAVLVETPSETPAPAPLAQPAAAEEVSEADQVPAQHETPKDVSADQDDAPVADHAEAPAQSEPEQPAAVSGSIADKLERIRAAVAQRGQAEYVEDQHAAIAAPAAAPVEDDALADDMSDDIDLGTLMTAAADDDVAEAAEEEDEEEDVAIEAEAEAEAEVEVAADIEAEIEVETDEDPAVEATTDPEEQAAEVVAEDTADQADTNDQPDADAALHEMDPNLAADIAEAGRVDEAEEVNDDPIRRVRARVVKMRRSDFEAEQEAENAALEADETPESVAETVDAVAADDHTEAAPEVTREIDDEIAEEDDLAETLRRELGDSSLDADAEDELMRELAQVTAGEDTDVSAGEDVDLDMADTEEEPAEITPLSELNAEVMEDQLEAEAEDAAVAEAPAEEDETENLLANMLGDDDADDAASDQIRDQGDSSSQETEEQAARNIFDDSDADVSRLLDETDREMEKGDTKRRRNAIQHLKAAVGAVRADKESGADTKADDDDKDVYREDLARVVRPRRPEGQTQTKRQMPPLMLVSEQRVDAPSDMPSGANIAPVRPRRVSSAALAVQEEQEIAEAAPEQLKPTLEGALSFADFAEERGAEDLVDVLEAAAAYANHVEGRETVTRPQIMQLASEALADDAPVEERLRSFGQLLRQGKIKKLKRGHFAVAENSRFNPN